MAGRLFTGSSRKDRFCRLLYWTIPFQIIWPAVNWWLILTLVTWLRTVLGILELKVFCFYSDCLVTWSSMQTHPRKSWLEICMHVFVTEVRQLDFLLNTGKKIYSKKGKTFQQLSSPRPTQPRNRRADKQIIQILLKTNCFLTEQPYYFEWYLDVNWTLARTVGGLRILVTAVLEPPRAREARNAPTYFTYENYSQMS